MTHMKHYLFQLKIIRKKNSQQMTKKNICLFPESSLKSSKVKLNFQTYLDKYTEQNY